MDLFSPDIETTPAARPLADRLRPQTLDQFAGQKHVLGEGKPLRQMLVRGVVPSLILWGPPGCGKTTLARLIARDIHAHFEAVSAIFSGVTDLRKIFAAAHLRTTQGLRTLLFVDEIHRFNKAQQDAFLPHVESGAVTLIGATTENPSFALNNALLSRCTVLELQRLSIADLERILQQAEDAVSLTLDIEARDLLLHMADGDGRALLNMVEQLADLEATITAESLPDILRRRTPNHDRDGDLHYNLISVLHKAVRGSDVDAALYWLARMLAGGEDPHFIARRMVRMASEDIGLADPQALPQTIAAWQAYERLGSPEGELALVQALVYLATAPKSNAVYTAFKTATKMAQDGAPMPPKHALNAPTRMMKDLGYGKGYQYDHDRPDGFAGQNYFPDDMPRQTIYTPVERGFEREITKRLAYWQKRRET